MPVTAATISSSEKTKVLLEQLQMLGTSVWGSRLDARAEEVSWLTEVIPVTRTSLREAADH